MASDKEYLDFVLEQLSALDGVSFRAMMGEYIFYFDGKVVGGIYDNRFLVKPTASARALLPEAREELPYEGAKPMLAADVDDRELLLKLIPAVASELPEPSRKKGAKK